MSYRWNLRLADGTVVAGSIQGCGGTIGGHRERLETSIRLANEGEHLGIYEPSKFVTFATPDIVWHTRSK